MKFLFLTVFATLMSVSLYAANLDVDNTSSGVVGTITVHYTDNASENFYVSSTGDYHFDIGSKTVSHIVTNGTTINVADQVDGIIPGPINVTFGLPTALHFVVTDNVNL